ncbi:MAG: glycosyltransferase [Patescibacteria group bacterium]
MDVTLVVPAYNEAERIGPMFEDYLTTMADSVLFHVVLNGCSDNTESVVKDWQAKYPERITYEVHKESYGKGWAVRLGFTSIRNEYVGYVDADGSTPAREFNKLLQALENVDGTIASRYAEGAEIANRVSWFRRIAGYGFRFLVRLIVELPYADTQCGAKVFKQDVIKKILPDLSVNNMAFDIELLLLCKQHNYQITEVPTYWEENKASTFITTKYKLVQTSLRMLKTTFQLRKRFK